MPRSLLAGQVALVTGAAGGIGRQTCLALTQSGVRVVAADLNESGTLATVAEIRNCTADCEAVGMAVDVRREDDVQAMVRQTLERFNRLDILVHSAGILRAPGSGPRMMAELSVAEFDLVVDTNLKGTFLCNRAVLSPMIRQRSGQIVNLASTAGRQGRALDAVYCASEFGVVGLTQSLAEEVRQFGIRVQAVLPDAVDTPRWDQNGPIRAPDWALPPERVAEVILYMLSLPKDAVLGEVAVYPFRSRKFRRRPESTPPAPDTPDAVSQPD